MAWELEKCLTYHFIAQLSGKNQMIMNEEATMARRGLGKFFGSRIKMWKWTHKMTIYYHIWHVSHRKFLIMQILYLENPNVVERINQVFVSTLRINYLIT